MPLLKIQRYAALATNLGGTLEVVGDVDVSEGLELELTSSVFTSTGVWTLMTWTGTLTGSAANVTLINSTAFSCAANPYQDGNSFKVVLS
jgi:hypothetical protein